MKTAIILFNLGGPLTLGDVKPFLRNLFSDKAIIGLPAFLRLPLAWLIAGKREKEAQHIYAAIGGGSPLLKNTEAQAAALDEALNKNSAHQFKSFIAMRYWHPFSDETAKNVKAFAPDKIIYLPLYPQYSTTTTASSFAAFDQALGGATQNTHRICCYPTLKGFIAAQAQLIRPLYETMQKEAAAMGAKKPRLLFSAHGLPEKTIAAGDPYQHQCELTAKALAKELDIPDLDWKNTYQSRVGPLKWIGPYTDAEIERAGAEGVPVIIAPIAFVSEHSETLYELDQQYRDLAKEKTVPLFARARTVSTHPVFIEGLAALVRGETENQAPPCAGAFRKCYFNRPGI